MNRLDIELGMCIETLRRQPREFLLEVCRGRRREEDHAYDRLTILK